MESGNSSEQAIFVPSELSVYPDFKAIHRPPPDDRLLPKKNHIEQNFYILNRKQRANRNDDVECICAFCSKSFSSFNSTRMRFHLTGTCQDTIRVAACTIVPDACTIVPDACKDFYQAERDREEAKAREREAQKTALYNEAAKISRIEMDKNLKRQAEEEASPNPRQLTITTNLKCVNQPSIQSMMVSVLTSQ
jgi:hypothetical protein